MLKIHAKNLETFTVLSLQGQIVTGETDILRTAVQSLRETSAVVLDLARVTTVDAHGLGVLLQLLEWTNANGMRFELMNVSNPMMRIFEITRLDTVFHITSSVEFFPKVVPDRRTSMVALKSCA
jgi:anti-sigma B factor antagonist